MDYIIGGLAGGGATIFSNPMDVIKVRLQLQGELANKGAKKLYRGVFHGMYVIAKADGVMALQKGLLAAVTFGFVMNSIRFGIYRNADKQGFMRDSNGEYSILRAAPWAWTSGVIGAVTGNPASVVRIRLQSSSDGSVAVGHQHNYTGHLDAIRKIYKKEGVSGFFTGARAMALRLGVGSVAQLTTFTVVKEGFTSRGLFINRPVLLAFVGSIFGGLCVSVTACPLDVVATRLYNQGSGKTKIYNGVIDCFAKTIKAEGLFGLYKGWLPLYLRLAPHTTVSLVIWDTLDSIFNKRYRNYFSNFLIDTFGGTAFHLRDLIYSRTLIIRTNWDRDYFG